MAITGLAGWCNTNLKRNEREREIAIFQVLIKGVTFYHSRGGWFLAPSLSWDWQQWGALLEWQPRIYCVSISSLSVTVAVGHGVMPTVVINCSLQQQSYYPTIPFPHQTWLISTNIPHIINPDGPLALKVFAINCCPELAFKFFQPIAKSYCDAGS